MPNTLENYIKEKRSLWDAFKYLGTWLCHSWKELISILFFVLMLFFLMVEVDDEVLKKLNDGIINAASILAAVLITFLAAKIVQLRQEKLSFWSDYHALTQKIHHFRAAVVVLYNSWTFWRENFKFRMENTYKELNFYSVRKAVFVHGTPISPLAEKFIHEEGSLANLYLQLRSFAGESGIMDATLYSGEFEIRVYYAFSQLDLWQTFDCGSGLYYCFNHEWHTYQNVVDFNAISHNQQLEVKRHCDKIDSARYKAIAFGPELYDLLGQQFTEDLRPRVYRLSLSINGPLPLSIRFLTWILIAMIVCGIIFPFCVSVGLLPQYFTALAASSVLAFLLYIALTFRKTLSSEAEIAQKKWINQND